MTEVGNYLAIWNYDNSEIVVPEEVYQRLLDLGWALDLLDGWIHPLSN